MAKLAIATITGGDRDLVQEMLNGEIKGKFSYEGINCNTVPPIMNLSMLTFYYH